MVNPQIRQVKIKTGMVTGLKQNDKIKKKKKKKAKDCENYPIKKQHRLEAAYTDFLQLVKSEKDLQEAYGYKETCLVLDLVKLEA
ncbi:unnamed protein product [Nyctereutes procyonoides]|uniref:(raccoon dog) hypothetical protein n=1 Tax=Nyctereutes procyonoides TaxID=34880 RepID=A0A811Y578_NYCPR|nr:unnamed protein product [Nyctereutes procyonoides]